jgi:hypothetical protein
LPEIRSLAAAYLRRGTGVIDLMEYTSDVLSEDSFHIAGGSSLTTDGKYYWRPDAAEYVELYGVAIDPGALAHMEEQNWTPRTLSTEEARAVRWYLYDLLGFRPVMPSPAVRGDSDTEVGL